MADHEHSLYNTVNRWAPGLNQVEVAKELAAARNPAEALTAASRFVEPTGNAARALKAVAKSEPVQQLGNAMSCLFGC